MQPIEAGPVVSHLGELGETPSYFDEIFIHFDPSQPPAGWKVTGGDGIAGFENIPSINKSAILSEAGSITITGRSDTPLFVEEKAIKPDSFPTEQSGVVFELPGKDGAEPNDGTEGRVVDSAAEIPHKELKKLRPDRDTLQRRTKGFLQSTSGAVIYALKLLAEKAGGPIGMMDSDWEVRNAGHTNIGDDAPPGCAILFYLGFPLVIIVTSALLAGLMLDSCESSPIPENKLVLPTTTPNRKSILYIITHPISPEKIEQAKKDGIITEEECWDAGHRWCVDGTGQGCYVTCP